MRKKIIHPIGPLELGDLSIEAADIAAEAVTVDKIGTGAVTNVKIGAREIGGSSIAYGATTQLQLTAADSIAIRDTVYFNASGHIARAQANSSSYMPAIGVALETIASGAIGGVATGGLVTGYNFSGYIGKQAYVSPDTAGGITPLRSTVTSGMLVQVIGHITNCSTLLVQVGTMLQLGGASY